MNDHPRCPKCPTDKDNQIIVSRTRPDCWYCCHCGNYFRDINGKRPNQKSLYELLQLEETPELRWDSEEVEHAKDHALASFYAMLNDGDRCALLGAHILIHGDLRKQETTESEDQADGKV